MYCSQYCTLEVFQMRSYSFWTEVKWLHTQRCYCVSPMNSCRLNIEIPPKITFAMLFANDDQVCTFIRGKRNIYLVGWLVRFFMCAKVIFRYYSCFEIKSEFTQRNSCILKTRFELVSFWFLFDFSVRISAHRITNKPMNALSKSKHQHDNPNVLFFFHTFPFVAETMTMADIYMWDCGGCCTLYKVQ